jgi:hypothetical protein
MSEVQKPKKTRIRKRSLDIQLEAALRDAAAACENGADPSTKGLIQCRLQIINHRLNRQRYAKLEKALAEVNALRTENERLKGELAQALKQIEQRTTFNPNETLEEKTARLLKTFDSTN